MADCASGLAVLELTTMAAMASRLEAAIARFGLTTLLVRRR